MDSLLNITLQPKSWITSYLQDKKIEKINMKKTP